MTSGAVSPQFDARLEPLIAALAARPGVTAVYEGYFDAAGLWAISFAIDTKDAEAWEEVRRFSWLFNNLYGAVADDVSFRPVVLEESGEKAERHLCWLLESLAADYTPERAVDVLLTPLAPFRPPLSPS